MSNSRQKENFTLAASGGGNNGCARGVLVLRHFLGGGILTTSHTLENKVQCLETTGNAGKGVCRKNAGRRLAFGAVDLRTLVKVPGPAEGCARVTSRQELKHIITLPNICIHIDKVIFTCIILINLIIDCECAISFL